MVSKCGVTVGGCGVCVGGDWGGVGVRGGCGVLWGIHFAPSLHPPKRHTLQQDVEPVRVLAVADEEVARAAGVGLQGVWRRPSLQGSNGAAVATPVCRVGSTRGGGAMPKIKKMRGLVANTACC